MSRPEYSVVIPVYESSGSVVELIERLRSVFVDVLDSTFEIILVDDGSQTAETWTTCETLASDLHDIQAVRLMRNFGKPGAVLCGLSFARGRWIITIDDDLQQRPEDIPELVAFRDHDVVVADYPRRRYGPVARFLSWSKARFDGWVLGLPCRMSPLKLIRSEVAQAMLEVDTAHPFIPALLAHVTSDFHAVAVVQDVSSHGNSRYSFRRRVRQFSNLLISNSSLLLRGIGLTGTLFSAGGFVFAGWVVFRKTIGGEPLLPGWASLVVINLVFGGLILLALSIVGEYLIRIVDGISRKPPFVIRARVGGQPKVEGNRD